MTPTNSTNTTLTGNYYNGVRCDWWCPDPAKGEKKIDPPTEEDGCICEIPDSRPSSERAFDYIDAFLGGFKSDDLFKNAQPCFTALRRSVDYMN